jgi:hypothetical protein
MCEVIMTLRKWQNCMKQLNEIIVQASKIDGSDALTNCSIGMSYGYSRFVKNANELEYISTQIGEHSKLINCSISLDTDMRRRENNLINRMNILKTLNKNNIYNILIDRSLYYLELPNYKFVISPEGNGIDCHRHYEALMAGCIPIIETNSVIEEKYGNVPILYTTDYSEITTDYLEKIYNEYLDKQFNFSKLFIINWSEKEKELIKERGNYWCTKINGIPHYIS